MPATAQPEKSSTKKPAAGKIGAELLEAAAQAPAFSAKLGRLIAGEAVAFESVAAPAQPFVAALAANAFLAERPSQNAWVLCPDARTQEAVYAGLAAWGLRDALFFPEHEATGFLEAIPDPDIAAERLAALHEISGSGGGRIVVATERSLGEGVPTPKGIAAQEIELAAGQTLDLEAMIEKLETVGYERAPQVIERGQFAVRGGILDVFSWQSHAPFRLELFGDEIESIRTFDVDQQTSIARQSRCAILLSDGSEEGTACLLRDYIGEGDLRLAPEIHPDVAADLGASILCSGTLSPEGFSDATACYDSPVGAFEAGDFIVQQARRKTFERQVADWLDDGWRVAIFFNNAGERERFVEVLGSDLETTLSRLKLGIAPLARGFTVPGARLAALSGAEIFGRYQQARAARRFNRERESRSNRAHADFRELGIGDLVVHADHGIAKYRGLAEHALPGRAKEEEVLVLEFADHGKLYVPLSQAHLVGRYVGTGKRAPKLSALGGKSWSKTKAAAQKSILDYAAQMLGVQAERDTQTGFAHPPDTEWQVEFESAFLYKETKDQLAAIEEAKRDMEGEKPMDRLICGDVGFGKTEVAIRAAFKAVMGGKQVAILVPTTVLAQQHYENFRERMSDYPVAIGLLSRYRTPRQQRETTRQVAAGSVDIVIGTHRLVSKDVSFKNLGLVVVDEEQRFGVKHKEKFKELFRTVDVLTLSATPIPRTLYLSLMGVRDMSTIETPPPNRYPVETTICGYDERVFRDAIDRELRRGGQVYFLHNRVASIGNMKKKIEALCPGARVGIGHGQMGDEELEDIMHQFVRGEIDVLVCTTIIESGIDIPNANTIIIDRADRFGLADLYQLRGRVGRSAQKAYAILLLPRDMMMGGDARKRVGAIKQYSSLGSGFRIAMRDLEIRGAGNLLGTQQSGHIAAVGFDLYCKLLRESIDRLAGRRSAERKEVPLRIDFLCTSEAEYLGGDDGGKAPAFIPGSYIEEPRLRIAAYKSLAEVNTSRDLKALIREWRDRFGRFPDAVNNLLRVSELRLAAAGANVSSIEIKDRKLMLERNGSYLMIGKRFPRLEAKLPGEMLKEAVEMVREA
ncbi:MAG: transcription-repair coupling factor [Verrucomicrobiales bacterium]